MAGKKSQLSFRVDAVDFHAGEHLPVSGATARVFAAAEFLHDQLLALTNAEHFGDDAGTLHRWLANSGVTIFRDS